MAKSRAKNRGARWRRRVRREAWWASKAELVARGWVEIAENTLVPAVSADLYPAYVPTHLRGRRA